MNLSELFLNRFLYRDNKQNLETKDSAFVSADSSESEPASIPSGGAAQDINTGNVQIDGGQLEPGTYPTTVLDVANWGWGQTCAFTSASLNTVTWGAGTFTSASGDTYAISAGTTGVMAAKTYIYLSLLDSETEYQVTTTSSDAVGLGKVLIAVAQNAAADATFMLSEATQIVGDNIIANTIDATKMNVAQLSAITANIGAITAGTITGITITGGTLQTASGTGQRVVIASSSNSISFYNASNDVVTQMGGGLDVAYAFRTKLDATTGTGLRVESSTVSDVGYRYLSSGNYQSTGAAIELTGATNTGTGVSIDHDGTSGTGVDVEVTNGAKAIEIANSGGGDSLSIISSDGKSIYISHTDDDTQGIEMLYAGRKEALYISGDDANATEPTVYVTSGQTDGNVSTVNFNRTSQGPVLELSASTNDSFNYLEGIRMNIANAGTGAEVAFRFDGSEYVAGATAVGSITGVVKVYTSDGLVYMPVYSSYS